jgi:hypothetical protein
VEQEFLGKVIVVEQTIIRIIYLEVAEVAEPEVLVQVELLQQVVMAEPEKIIIFLELMFIMEVAEPVLITTLAHLTVYQESEVAERLVVLELPILVVGAEERLQQILLEERVARAS